MSAWQRIVLASTNTGKLREFLHYFAHKNIQLELQNQFTTHSAAETGWSFIENALIKARFASLHAGLPALADDSGLCVTALNGAPGIYSARYAADDPKYHKTQGTIDPVANVRKLLDHMKNFQVNARHASFHCVLALVRHAQDPLPLLFHGQWLGQITHTMVGQQGFGYDPVFQPEGYTCTAAELSPEQKYQISHRAQAVQQLMQWLAAQQDIDDQ